MVFFVYEDFLRNGTVMDIACDLDYEGELDFSKEGVDETMKDMKQWLKDHDYLINEETMYYI